MKPNGDQFAALSDDLDVAIVELVAAVDRDPALWNRGLAGKWTAGQHADHVRVALTRMVEPLEAAAPALRAGKLPPPPGRGLAQTLFFWLIVENGWMPRGAKTSDFANPASHPDHDVTIAGLRRDAKRLRAIGEPLSPAERDRLWIQNPFRAAWHYNLPEAVRMQAVHARHHTRQIAEIPAAERVA